jgi:hypothetical protein
VLYGVDETGKPRAARFPGNQIDLVNKAAALMHLQFCRVTTPLLEEVSHKLPVGRIYSNGRGFVPFVRRELYSRLIDAAAGKRRPTSDAEEVRYPADWNDISAGHLVIALDDSAPLEGWWEAVVVARDADVLTLRWRDYPREPSFARSRMTVGLLDPTGRSKPATSPGPDESGPSP